MSPNKYNLALHIWLKSWSFITITRRIDDLKDVSYSLDNLDLPVRKW